MKNITLIEGNNHSTYAADNYSDLVDIKTIYRREGTSRLENARLFYEQIKNPHNFKVAEDIVEIRFSNSSTKLENILIGHLSRALQSSQ